MTDSVWSEPRSTRLTVIRFMYHMAFAFHMSLHTFLLGVTLMDELVVPVFQSCNDRYFKAGVALMLAFALDDCHQLRLHHGDLTYAMASPDELIQLADSYLAVHVPPRMPEPGTTQACWTAMQTALIQCPASSRWQGHPLKVRLYHRLVERFPSTQHTKLFQLLWIMPLVQLPVDEQEQLAVQLMQGQLPTTASGQQAVQGLRGLQRHPPSGLPYPDWTWVEADFPQLSPLYKHSP